MAKGVFYTKGMNEGDQEKVRSIVSDLFMDQRENSLFFARPVCFAYYGIDVLTDLVSESEFTNPRIEGCSNGKQHYWLAFDIGEESYLIDPFFKYIGLEEYTGDVLDREKVRCYEKKSLFLIKEN